MKIDKETGGVDDVLAKARAVGDKDVSAFVACDGRRITPNVGSDLA